MKDETIIRNKLQEGLDNNLEICFAVEFYSIKSILRGLNTFDLRNVDVNIKCRKTSKGFSAYFVKLKSNKNK